MSSVAAIGALAALAALGLAATSLASRAYFLAPSRAGRLMMLANALHETLIVKLRVRRSTVDAAVVSGAVLGALLSWGWGAAAAFGLALCAAWVAALEAERQWASGRSARQLRSVAGKVPLPLPCLAVVVRGPVLRRRRRRYDLGSWPEGLRQRFEVIVQNPSTVRAQLPLRIDVDVSGGGLVLDGESSWVGSAPEPGASLTFDFSLAAGTAGAGGYARVCVAHGDDRFERQLKLDEVLAGSDAVPVAATIRRWKHGAKAAFCWRGDHDLYDPCTFQSEEGLRVALGLSRRTGIPSSLMLSARLSLDGSEHEEFCRQFGWDRRSKEVESFVEFLRRDVTFEQELEWPLPSDGGLRAELGNHGYLHLGTHAAAHPGNGWKSHSRFGAGTYPWVRGRPDDSLAEQRDGIVENARVVEVMLGVQMASFTIPGDVLDGQTARAAEAAGIEVGSETDGSKLSKVFRLTPPHHPDGCDRLVELPRKYPKDPEEGHQVAMLRFWIGVARRTGRAVVFLSHHHLRLFEGTRTSHLTEAVLRYVAADTDGDVWIGTLTALGRYWRDVLSERTRSVSAGVRGGEVWVTNRGPRAQEGLPVEVSFGRGRSCLVLVSAGPAESKRLVFGAPPSGTAAGSVP